MLIGVDGASWHNTRGYGRHARALLSNLVRLDQENCYTFFFDSPEGLNEIPSQVAIELVSASRPTAEAASASGRRSVTDMWRMSRAMSNRKFDLLLFPTIYSYVPIISRARKIVMIHDVIADRFPEYTLPSTAARLFWKAKVAVGRRQADAIVTVSDYSRQEIIKQFGLVSKQVYVVGEASDPVFRVVDDPAPTAKLRSLGFDGNGRQIVYLGGFGPHKNIGAVVEAFAKLSTQERFADVCLVMVGEYDQEVFYSHFNTIYEQIAGLEIGDRTLFTGYLQDEDLVMLLNLSALLVLPSFMEGFGLPAVEAAACGCPVVATTASPLPQLLGEGGLYVDPTKPNELMAALEKVLDSRVLRQRMREAGLEATKALTWEAAAQQLLDVINEVAG